MNPTPVTAAQKETLLVPESIIKDTAHRMQNADPRLSGSDALRLVRTFVRHPLAENVRVRTHLKQALTRLDDKKAEVLKAWLDKNQNIN